MCSQMRTLAVDGLIDSINLNDKPFPYNTHSKILLIKIIVASRIINEILGTKVEKTVYLFVKTNPKSNFSIIKAYNYCI